MCIRSEGFASRRPTDPDNTASRKLPSRGPSVPVKKLDSPEHRRAEHPVACKER
jgi:hypothetical protein